MQKTAQDSQSKSGNLGNGEAVYAFKIARINPENLSLRFWTLGGGVKRFNLACSEIPALVEQIDGAIADGDFCLWFDGARFAIPEKLLRGIRTQFSSYAVQGGNDAHVVREGVSTPRKSKASARADGGRVPEASSPSEVAGSVGRQFNEERRIKNEELAGEVARIVDEELRKAVMPLLAEIDAIAALVKECVAELSAVSKKFTTRVLIGSEKRDRRIAKASAVRAEPFNGSGTAAEGSISTRGGRTSVVVGRRKVS